MNGTSNKRSREEESNSDSEQPVQYQNSRIKVGQTRNVDASMVPQAPKVPKTLTQKENSRRLIVVLEQATLEAFKVGKDKDARFQLLNADDHVNILKKNGRETYEARPDITHQVSGCLQRTTRAVKHGTNVAIE
jgi:rRNA small subunit pseudouridine methyltransferase Nep1